MTCFYIECKNDTGNYVWVKFVLKKKNDLSLDDIVRSVNQFLINTRPTDVFSIYPNILFIKENPTLYRNYSMVSKIRLITTSDMDAIYTQTFMNYSSLKDAIHSILLEEKNNGRESNY